MAKKQAAPAIVPTPPASPGTTPVRNTAIPKTIAAKPARVVTHEMIAYRAYEISQSGNRRSDDDNWLAAERELKGL